MLWDEATHREERYAATAIARHRTARAWQDPDALDLYRHLVVTGAWWDHLDEVASHLVGGVLAGHRDDVTPVMRAWAVDDDLWVRRTAVLCLYLLTAATSVAAILLPHVRRTFAAMLIFAQTLLVLGVVALLEQHPLPSGHLEDGK